MNTEIRSLIENWLEGDLGFEDAEQLRAWLRTDDAHLADFLREASLGRQLRDLLVGERMSAAVLDDLTTLEPVATCDPLVADEDSDSRATDSALPMPLRSRLVGVLGLILPEAISPRIHPGRFVVACLSLTVVFWAVLFAVVSQRPGSSEPAQVAAHNEDPSQPPIVARLTGAIDATWDGDPALAPVPGSHLRLKRRLSLKSGLVQLAFNTGATVVVEGPAEFSISDENGLQFNLGRLVAQVPEPARGFAVETPQTRIVDLGTEFGVVVEQQGQTVLLVHEGQVELALLDQPASNSQLVVGGEAMRVENTSVQPIELPSAQLAAFRTLFERNVPGFFKNLVINGGFVSTAEPIGWTISGGTAHMSAHNDYVFDSDGDDYLLEMATGNVDETHLPSSVVYQVVDVTAGQPHYFSVDYTAWANPPGTISTRVDIFDGSVDVADVTGNPIGSGDLLGVSLAFTRSKTYQRYRTMITPMRSQVTIRFSDIGNKTTVSKDLWVDNVRLIAAEKPVAQGLPGEKSP